VSVRGRGVASRDLCTIAEHSRQTCLKELKWTHVPNIVYVTTESKLKSSRPTVFKINK